MSAPARELDIDALLDAIARATTGDLSARAPVDPDEPYSDDPLHVLAHSLNILFEDLEAREAQLQDERSRLQAILDQMPHGVVLAEAPRGKLVYFNEAAQALLGRSESVESFDHYPQAFDVTLEDGSRLGPDDWPMVRVLRRGETVSGMVTLVATPAGPRWLRVHAGPVRDRTGAIIGGVSLFFDVTEERRMEMELRRERDTSDLLLRSISAAGIGIIIVRGGRLAYANDAFASIVGYGQREILDPGFSFLSLVEPEDRPLVMELARVAPADEPPARTQIRLRRKDGSLAIVERSSMLLDRGEGPERFVIVQDVTQRHLAEVEAREQREIYATLLRAESDLGQGVVVADGIDRIVYANDAYCSLTGYSLEELTDPAFDLRKLYAPASLALLEARQRELRAGRPVAKTFELEIVQKSGETLWVEVAVMNARMGGRDTRIAILRDVTARRARDAQVAQMQGQLGRMEKLSAMGQLVSGVAHELRTPLAYLNNNVHLLRSRLRRAAERGDVRPGVLEEVEPLAEEATDGVDRINRLVSDLRRFSTPSSSALRGRTVDAAREAIRIFDATHPGRRRVVAHVEDVPHETRDIIAVQQIILNLLENAYDASPPQAAVSLHVRSLDEATRIEVIDEGAGIPPEAQARIFEPFFTTKGHGTGLGLAIVKRIVDGLRGTITMESAPGKGTRVVVDLPAERSNDGR